MAWEIPSTRVLSTLVAFLFTRSYSGEMYDLPVMDSTTDNAVFINGIICLIALLSKNFNASLIALVRSPLVPSVDDIRLARVVVASLIKSKLTPPISQKNISVP